MNSLALQVQEVLKRDPYDDAMPASRCQRHGKRTRVHPDAKG